MTEPLPCPFCGCTEYNIVEKDLDFVTIIVNCSGCGASGPDFSPTEEEANAIWNKRVVIEEAINCPFCGSDSISLIGENLSPGHCFGYCSDCFACGPSAKNEEEADSKWVTRIK